VFANVTLAPQPNWELSTPGEVAIWGICLALAAVLVGWLIIAHTCVWPQRPRYVVLFLLVSVALVLGATVVCAGWLLIAFYTAVWPQRPRYVVLFLLASVALWLGAEMAATRGDVRRAAQERLKYEREREALERKIEVEKASP
jgi:hypothetical protein